MWSHTGKQPLHWSCLLQVLAVTLDAALSSLVWPSSASVRQIDSQGWGWFFWPHFSAFFSEILFFWKLVSHGGLDFSIFVSSTIWNQCFRSKNCSTAEGRLKRNSCTQDWLSPSRNQRKTWIVKLALESVWFRYSDSEKVFVQNKCKGVIRDREWSTLPSIPWVEEGASGLHCSLSGNVPGVDCSKEEGKGSVCGGLLHSHQYCLPVPGGSVEHSVLVAAQLKSDQHLPWDSDLKNTTGPSLTQADRFLLVFRVCFCLAPFEIGYDVGGKAPASEPCGVWSASACHFLHRQSRKGRSQFPNFFNAYVCDYRS